jgi:hypothetical protein
MFELQYEATHFMLSVSNPGKTWSAMQFSVQYYMYHHQEIFFNKNLGSRTEGLDLYK